MPHLPALPSELKHLSPFIQRADELLEREPVISYFCYLHCANLAMKTGKRSRDVEDYLVSLLGLLEEIRPTVVNKPALATTQASVAYLLEFSSRVFLTADNEDRAGQAGRMTAKMFLIASHIMDVAKGLCDGGSPLSSTEASGVAWPREMEERLKYARWKTVDICRALNEGRKPAPGPPGSEPLSLSKTELDQKVDQTQLSIVNQSTQTDSYDTAESLSSSLNVKNYQDDAPAFTPASDVSQQSSPLSTPQQQPQLPLVQPEKQIFQAQSFSHPVQTQSPPNIQRHGVIINRAKLLSEAEKYCRYTLSSIQFEDIPSALINLKQTMHLLGQLQQPEQQ